MTPDDADDLVAGLAERVPDSAPPLTELVRAGRSAARRRRRTTLVGVAAAVALVVGGGAVAQAVWPGRHSSVPAQRPQPNTRPPVVTAPAGPHLAGRGRAVVTVPASWGAAPGLCGFSEGEHPYVEYDGVALGPPGADPLCLVPNLNLRPTPQSSLQVGPAGSAAFAGPGGPSLLRLSDGTAYDEQVLHCTARSCLLVIEVPSQDAGFTLRTVGLHADAVAHHIAASLRLLPPGRVVVPAVHGRSLAPIYAAGLGSWVREIKAPAWPEFAVVRQYPAPGTIVSTQSSVQVDLAAARRGSIAGTLEIAASIGSTTRRAASGSVTLSGPVTRTVRVDSDGRWTAELPVGDYTVTGRTSRFRGCRADGTFTTFAQPESSRGPGPDAATVICPSN